MILLDGKRLAGRIKEEVKEDVSKIAFEGRRVCLAVIQVGSDPASSVYVRNKKNACDYVGIESMVINLDEGVTTGELIECIDELNHDDMVHGILVQLPLPKRIDECAILRSIAPEKDVDGFHEMNVGKLVIGREGVVPCTAAGIIKLLVDNDIEIEGKHCVVVGRSDIVGKPTAMELLHHNGTVTICHSKTRGLKDVCKTADILICAIGKPKFFNRDYVRPGAVVVDVGIHRQKNGTLCGDVDFDDVKDIVSAITPVPGGVGPMTVAMLLRNCVGVGRRKDKETC